MTDKITREALSAGVTGPARRRAGMQGHLQALAFFCMLSALIALPLALRAAPDAAGDGLRLIMVEEVGCRYCLAWDRDVGRVYGKTAEARLAPLVKVRRGATLPKDWRPVVYTPTFILADGGREIGRITGYPGESYFWEELKELLAATGRTSNEALPSSRAQAQSRAGPGLPLWSAPAG